MGDLVDLIDLIDRIDSGVNGVNKVNEVNEVNEVKTALPARCGWFLSGGGVLSTRFATRGWGPGRRIGGKAVGPVDAVMGEDAGGKKGGTLLTVGSMRSTRGQEGSPRLRQSADLVPLQSG